MPAGLFDRGEEARLEGMRRVPALRGTSGSPASIRRRSMSAANSASGTGRSVLEVGDAIISSCLLTDALVSVGTVLTC